jgi:predicted enzyme related to lactoylglutathione lyase
MNPVVHFEMPAEDINRMNEFYAKVFGWQTQNLGPEMSSYVVVKTTEIDEKTGFPSTPGRINGGFYKKDPAYPGQHPSVVIAVDDVQEQMKLIVDAGGKILSGPDAIPGVGLYVAFLDTEGNRVSMLQPSKDMKPSHNF